MMPGHLENCPPGPVPLVPAWLVRSSRACWVAASSRGTGRESSTASTSPSPSWLASILAQALAREREREEQDRTSRLDTPFRAGILDKLVLLCNQFV